MNPGEERKDFTASERVAIEEYFGRRLTNSLEKLFQVINILLLKFLTLCVAISSWLTLLNTSNLYEIHLKFHSMLHY